ncbi:MAG: hypothetical protein ACK4NR_08550 [Micavibrio sp.]
MSDHSTKEDFGAAVQPPADRKYELLADQTVRLPDGTVLYRIRALRDFGTVKAGKLGGYIQSEGNLSHEGSAWVFDYAQVEGGARIIDEAQVRDEARVRGTVVVSGFAIIEHSAQLSGDCRVGCSARVGGGASVTDGALVTDNAQVYGRAEVGGTEVIDGKRIVSSGTHHGDFYLWEVTKMRKARVAGQAL